MMDSSDQDHFGHHPDQRDPRVQRIYRPNLYSQNSYLHAAYQMNPHKEDQYAFPQQHQTQPFYQDTSYGTYVVNPQQPLDDYYASYGPEYADFMYPAMVQDEFGDMEEISTRPRLTKEQVEVLESQFQANHKPNSQVKRQLAIQTKLTLPRVANWFQNRRAKAKQQKKQEEFEAQNGGSTQSGSDSRSVSKATSSTPSSPSKSMTSPIRHSAPRSVNQDSPSPTKRADASKEASWASLQRALNQAKAAQGQQPAQAKVTMAPPELPPQPSAIKLPLRISQAFSTSRLSGMDSLSHQRANLEPYPSPITLQDNTFDFGFDQDSFDTAQMADPIDPSSNYSSQSFVVTPEDWDEPLATPKNKVPQHDPLTALPSPGLTMPSYPGSRRQSTTEELSNNFGNFALANSSPNNIAARRDSEVIRAPENGSLDIAARRKRPRPAALTSSSLRSRSYGAMTSASPTFRQGMITPTAPHTVRHVKSAGHGLNARYAGVRKASSAQRSPMCVASFAEAEAFRQLMGQQATVAQSLSELPQPLLSPDIVSGRQLHEPEKNPLHAQNIDISHQFQRPLHIATASPPITPMAADFMTRGLSQQSLIPPASAPPQYASFPDYTPPYSAGPLTGSSWSDAPLTSPDVPSFPPVTYVPSLGYPQQSDILSTNFQQFVLPSDPTTDLCLDSQFDQKGTEFFIQEFPNQKREHARVAQQLAQQKPRSYVFNNSAPHDFDQE